MSVSSEPVPSGPYLLAVANRKPHKNHWLMVELLARLRARGLLVRLVVVGERYPYWESVLAHANQLGVADAMVDEGVVSDHRLRRLYDQALACLVPSRLEGFGLPMVEAMACGAPVIASDLAWAREVGADAVMYADPEDPEAWADIVSHLVAQPVWRAAWVARGLARATGFTWAQSATRTADVLYEALVMGGA
jgi:glycosyltransferase involved in cell wall biosynthesis